MIRHGLIAGAGEYWTMRRTLPHERLTVYHKAAALYEPARRLVQVLRFPHLHLADQLLRALASISLNIAEGASEYSGGDKARFYRIALRSAGEGAAAIDLLLRSSLVDPESATQLLNELGEVVAMLTALTRKHPLPRR